MSPATEAVCSTTANDFPSTHIYSNETSIHQITRPKLYGPFEKSELFHLCWNIEHSSLATDNHENMTIEFPTRDQIVLDKS